MSLLDHLRGDTDPACRCVPAFETDRLLVDATDCPGDGRLAAAPACRATVVRALRDRDVDRVVTRADGVERAYETDAAALLVAAGRFAALAAVHDESLAGRVGRDPLAVARQATGRAGPVADIAAETGLAELAARATDEGDALRPFVGPTVARSRIARDLPPGATLVDHRELSTGAVARVYERPGDDLRTYHLEPVELGLDGAALSTLARAAERLAAGRVAGGERAPARAVRTVTEAAPTGSDGTAGDAETLRRVLRKHTRGNGVLDDLFADPACSDVFVTAPAAEGTLRVHADGEPMRTNVRLTERGVETLASRFRRASGRAFSRASPTLDATTRAGDRRVRVAGVTDPVSDGVAFAFRAHDREAWTLPGLVDGDTLPPDAAALCSLAVERGAATLVAGGRGAGKTTLLGALCFELPAAMRTVAIEDTPELPVDALQRHGHDVQRLRVDEEGLGPSEALRTALRLGEGALVVGEVRGEEAPSLFEAMRVGSNDGAVLGTVHGEGAAGVGDRLREHGVDDGAFAATDLLVTCERVETGRRVARIEEVTCAGDFATLFERAGADLVASDRIARGNSRFLAGLARPTESYADVRDALDARRRWLDRTVTAGDLAPEHVVAAHARRRGR
ncbi:ATPase, T2SS/T4P/T4SS family [Halomarina oriensis]|uniref:Type II secretion protein n=1 Tax=Halomarina oriensis TaxID=671145 RepID=A0A6B0GPF6_9EURY|nr:ATPase, T2SS/T4P/T4SS family [Halomarina oriensis]MWG35429.1 type II secretion protein [Halomarina oriensis]